MGSLNLRRSSSNLMTQTFRYRIVIEPIPSNQGGGYEAFIPTLGRSTCVAVGDTEEEALCELMKVKEDVINSWYEEGLPIPFPENEDTFHYNPNKEV